MAYSGPGFSIAAAAKGSEAVDTALTSFQTQASDAEATNAGNKANTAKAAYEVDRYKGLQDYMKGKQAGASGTAHYDTLTQAQELQQRQQQIDQESNRIGKIAPEDQKAARAGLEKMQKDKDNLQEKVYKQTEGHLGEQHALLGAVNDETSLQGARQYARGEVEAMADKAIEDKKIDPSNRENFIKDAVNKLLPEHYDAKGKAQIETKLNENVSTQDQIKNKQAENAHIRALAELKRADQASIRLAQTTNRQIQSDNVKALAAESRARADTIKGNNEMIKSYESEIGKLQKEADNMDPEIPGDGWFASKVENPQKTTVLDRAEELQAQVDRTREENHQLLLSHQVAEEKTKGIPKPKETSSKKTTYTTEQTNWIIRAKQANPGMSEEDIIAAGKEKGKL